MVPSYKSAIWPARRLKTIQELFHPEKAPPLSNVASRPFDGSVWKSKQPRRGGEDVVVQTNFKLSYFAPLEKLALRLVFRLSQFPWEGNGGGDH